MAVSAGHHHLPSYPTTFIGREGDAADLMARLEASRLVTLVGMPGCGKTRLALEVARRAPAFDDGVWWCDLAGTSDPAHVPHTVASALHVPEESGRPVADSLADALVNRRALLVLDNCEHQIAACGALAQTLLDRCQHLTLLATSLQPLGLPLENAWAVSPLLLPAAEDPAVGETESVRLFVDRARRVDPSFELTPANASAVGALCRRLDGLPLAIELAAARMRLLTVEQIHQRLDDALGILTRSEFDRSPRHRTLRATLDWTYSLLTETEQALLRQLSVFSGSFALDMVEAVSDRGTDRSATPLDSLSGLVDKSLVLRLPSDGAVGRYRLPEVIRQYARSALEDSGQAAEARTRHLTWIRGLAEQSEAGWVGPDRAAWLNRLDLDHDEVRAALRWARTSRQVTTALHLAKAAWRYWFTRGHWTEGRAWSEEFLALDAELGHQAPSALRADMLYRAGTFAFRHHDFPAATRHLEEGLALYRAASPSDIPGALNVLAMIAQLEGDRSRAVRLYEEALATSRAHNDRWIVGVTLVNLGGCLREQGEYRRAAQCLDELAAIGDTADLAAHAAAQTGALAAATGDFERGRNLLEDAAGQFRRLGDQDTLAEVLEELGRLGVNYQSWDLAEHALRECLQVAEAVGSSYRAAFAAIGLAHVALARGEFDQAERLYRESLQRSLALGDSLGAGKALHGIGALELERGKVADAVGRIRDALRYLRATGRPPDVILAMEDLACALSDQGEMRHAGRLMAVASAWRLESGAPRPPLGRARCHEAIERIRTALGDEDFRKQETRADAGAWMEALAATAEAAPVVQAARAAPRLQVYALGPTKVVIDGQVVTSSDWKYLKARELFFYLLSVSSSTKEQIGVDLWPEASAAELRSSFHRTLHHARRALQGAEWIRFDGENYRFDASQGLWYDVEGFESHLKEAHHALTGAVPSARAQAARHLEAALALARGEFLADVEAGEWAASLREDLRRRGLEARLALGHVLFADASYAKAAETYRAVISLDPYLETAHRELMRCLARLGEGGQAARHYQGLVRLLREDLETSPAPETRLLYERVRRGDDV